MSVLTVNQLAVSYGQTEVLKNITFDVKKGEILAIVGESGSGKTTIFKAIQKFLGHNGKITAGTIAINGSDTTRLSKRRFRKFRGRVIGTVFQEPGSTLNPARKIASQFRELLHYHFGYDQRQSDAVAVEAMQLLNLHQPRELLTKYPFELSGGMQQRLSLAMAMSLKPQIIMADEPTSSLDATVQKKIIDELIRLRDKSAVTIVIITHNLALASYMSDRLLVLNKGGIVEYGETKQIIANPRHPYTMKLIDDIPQIGRNSYD